MTGFDDLTIVKPTIEDVAQYGNLLVAHGMARKKYPYSYPVKHFEERKDHLLHAIENSILNGTYHTSKYHDKVIIDMRKERLISRLPYFPDRIVHWAIMNQLVPILMQIFSPNTHAAIRGRGIHSALQQTRKIIREHPEYKYYLKLDIHKYFQSMNQTILKDMFRRFIEDERLLGLLDENVNSYPTGIPIGNYTSQYWANLYLTPFDEMLERSGFTHIRYMDDVIVFGETSSELHFLEYGIEHYLEMYLNLSVKHNWQVFPIGKRGIDFAGYRIYPNRVLIRKTTFRGLRRKILRIKERIIRNKFLTDYDRSVIASYAGWAKFCSRKSRTTMYNHYFKPLLELLPKEQDKFCKNISRLFV